MGVPTPPFKRGIVRVQEMYPSRGEGISGDVTDSDRKSRPRDTAKQVATRRGARMVFGVDAGGAGDP